jgi:hypothetical protein
MAAGSPNVIVESVSTAGMTRREQARQDFAGADEGGVVEGCSSGPARLSVDLGITVIPVKSQTGPISSTMGKLLWAIQAWYAEMENSEKSEAIKAGQARARAGGKHMGRPRRVFNREEVVRLRNVERLSWPEIARRTGAGVGTVVQAYRDLTMASEHPPS